MMVFHVVVSVQQGKPGLDEAAKYITKQLRTVKERAGPGYRYNTVRIGICMKICAINEELNFIEMMEPLTAVLDCVNFTHFFRNLNA